MPPRPRKVPVRTCTVCGLSYDKKQLARVVRTPEGQVRLDPTGKLPGRGAYVCDRLECRFNAAAARQLSRSLEATVTPEALAGWFGTPTGELPAMGKRQKA